MKLVIVNYHVGNIGSIVNMLKRIGVDVKLAQGADDIFSADKLLLPGVGAFDAGMSQLQQSGLVTALQEKVFTQRTPILGICLGMQLLFEQSEEGQLPGLGWLAGRVQKFQFSDAEKLRIPHMGWNYLQPVHYDSLFYGLEEEARFYFAHSYYVNCEPGIRLAMTEYGAPFVSAVQKENIYGVQFHPEKSHKYGMQLLKNFIERS